VSKNNTELLVMVTPEIVRPIARGQAAPEIKMPKKFLDGPGSKAPQTPGMDTTGPVPVKPPSETIPVEQLLQSEKALPSTTQGGAPQIQFVPMLTQPGQAPQPMPPTASPSAPAAPAASPKSGGGGGTGASE
jgi:pilus assembly protein CpaC